MTNGFLDVIFVKTCVHEEPLFNPNDEFLSISKNDWIEMTKETFNKVFKNSAIKRAGFDGIKRNIEFIKRK